MQDGHQNAAVTAVIIAGALGVLAFFPSAGASARPGQVIAMQRVSFEMPEETIPAELADTDGELVVGLCSACHSLEYITTQPRGLGEKFWHDEVTKMVKVYGAPIEQGDADAVTAILAKKFG